MLSGSVVLQVLLCVVRYCCVLSGSVLCFHVVLCVVSYCCVLSGSVVCCQVVFCIFM